MTSDRNILDIDFLDKTVRAIAEDISTSPDRGEVSQFLPELAAIDPRQFGLAVVTADGYEAAAGDIDEAFTIQSISKVFALSLALETFGDEVWTRVDREPSGDPFNSITDLERHGGYPRNPFINPGALVIVDMLLDKADGPGPTKFVESFLAEQIGADDFAVDEAIFESEIGLSHTNRALAHLAKSFGNLNHPVDDVIAAYVRQCAIALSCRQLARAGRYLMLERAGAGAATDPSRRRARQARRVASLMLTCGQYDGSGDFAFRVGLPAKSGIAGGLLAIVPNTATIAVWAPGLDANGNSLLGTLALERLAEAMDWSVFGAVERC